MVVPSAWSIDRYVGSGGSFQAAIDAAQPGDTITLQAGATFRGNFILREKSGTAWITIRSSAINLLPPAGARVKPSDAIDMPKVVAPNTAPALATAARAHNYRIIGVEFYTQPGIYNWTVVRLGAGNETSLDKFPYNLELDRVYIHGDAKVGGKRGVDLNSKSTTIKNSYISDFKSTWQDTQAIAMWNGPGPYLIENNYLEASGENLSIGGAVPSISGMIPSDVTIRRNHFYKPFAWRTTSPQYAGTPWMVKNLMEFKAGRRVRVEGNVFENCWKHHQDGWAIIMPVSIEGGKARWNVIEDIMFRANIIRNAGSGVNVSGYDTYANGGATRRVRFENNVFENIDQTKFGGSGRLFILSNKAESIVMDHNTSFQYGDIITMVGLTPLKGLAFTNNITRHNTYGILGGGQGSGTRAINYYAPGAVVTKNVMFEGYGGVTYPPGNIFLTSVGLVGFTDVAGKNYKLRSTSPYRGFGTDGKDLGADINLVNSLTAGVVQGTAAGTAPSIGAN